MSVRHLGKVLDWRQAMCGAVMTSRDKLPTSNEDAVECKACLKIIGERGVEAPTPRREVSKEEAIRRAWTIHVVGGSTDLSFAEWKYLHGHSNERPARHTPPRMEDDNGLVDGVFVFHGTHSDLGGQMEVVPMTTGNVEFTISSDDSQQDGLVFNLSHLDRADMLRALLHDFHYSPERGGPNDSH